MTTKQIKTIIKNKYIAIPEGQIEPGIYLDKVGYKYITILNTYEPTNKEQIYIEDFYLKYILKI